jgi:hypothetical protein
MIGAFTFEQGGRTYTCTSEVRKADPPGTWWWFAVSRDQQRYAPFLAVAGDTQTSVRTRIVTYYEHLLWVRAQPAVPRERFSRPGRPAGPAAPAPAAPAKP